MRPKPTADLAGLWALIWRSFAFLPAMLGVFALLMALFFALLILPILSVIHLSQSEFYPGLTTLAIWLLLAAVSIHFKIHRTFKGPPSYL